MILIMDIWNDFHGPNVAYLLELYERYRQNPQEVDEATRNFFENWTPPIGERLPITVSPDAGLATAKIVGAANLAQAIRAFGYLDAQLDPLGSAPPGAPWLRLDFHGITEDDLTSMPGDVLGGPLCASTANALEAIQALRNVYSSTIGYDYDHVRVPKERNWLRQAAECGQFRPPDDPIDSLAILERLTQVEAFEQFIHRIFPGKTRFSIEGVDMLLPMLDEIMEAAGGAEICTINLGMAHRGRLNVLAHVLGKPYPQILAEFKDPAGFTNIRNELGWTGDVKYHKGARRAVEGEEMIRMVVCMPPNPSHLEHINPVVLGMSRAAGSRVDRPGSPEFYPDASLPILMHGDASFSGQGIVAESLNMSQLSGYSVAGTIHIITNNQLGYTTDPGEAHSTLFASDLAKGFEIPIIHVNADDPQACLEAARTAFAYRHNFNKDFLIDLIGYRRYGHNEGDEPTFTQPVLYQRIEKHPSVRALWASRLVESQLIDEKILDQLLQRYMSGLQEVLEKLQVEPVDLKPQLTSPPPGEARRVKTAIPLKQLAELNQSLLTIPDHFSLHRKLQRAMQRRREVMQDADKKSIDWATSEELAFASILADGIPIRLTGEDVARGTFSQRHGVFHDTKTGETLTPLQALPQAKASYEVVNSPLSEVATIGFEFGYNIQAKKRLVVWEAQYGDFINVAQTMIDEFLVSARAKWEQTPSLVLLLPHGHEGQGPDHSSGRLERFLQLAAQTNLRIANCTTAAQYFHLLRRQAALLESDPLPLIVMTPKSLLRHPLTASSPKELEKGSWQPVLEGPSGLEKPEHIRRAILCSGKIYIDLITSEFYREEAPISIIRVEQLYPFPSEEIMAALESHPQLEEVVWIQEEPRNMGAWNFVQPRLIDLISGRWPLHYIGRIPNSSPAEGSTARHDVNQRAIIQQALTLINEQGQKTDASADLVEEAGLVERD